MYRLKPISPGCTHSNNTSSLQQQIQVKRCTYRTHEKWQKVEDITNSYCAVCCGFCARALGLISFEVAQSSCHGGQQSVNTHVHIDLFDVTKWMKETWKLKLRSLGLSCQCSQSQPHQAKHSPRCCYVLAAQAGSDEFNSQLTASFSLSSYSSCNINTSTDKVSMEPAHATTVPPLTIGILSLCMQSRNCSTLLYPNQPSILHSSEVSHHSSSCFKCKPSHRYM